MTLLNLLNNNLLDDLFYDASHDFFASPYYAYKPKADMIETEDGYTLSFDVPGFNQENLSVKVEKGVLKVDGTFKDDEKSNKKDEKKYLRRERYNREFHRAFKLPDNVDTEKINASLKNGVLEVNIDKTPEQKPKQIRIQ